MVEYKAFVEGMMCEHCEKRVNDAVKKAFKPKSVETFHDKGFSLILTKSKLKEEEIREVIENTGFIVKDITSRDM